MKAKVIETGEMVEVYHEPQHGQTTNIYKECVLVNGRMWSEDELDFYVETSEAPQQYIKKSALVTEIERRKKQNEEWKNSCKGIDSLAASMVIQEDLNILSFINNLEAKEVDLEHLEQEVEDFCYEYDDRKEKWYELCPNDRKLLYNPTWANFAMSIAKHFFELGLKVQKGEEDVNSPEEECNIVYKNITIINKDGNVLKAKIEQKEKV